MNLGCRPSPTRIAWLLAAVLAHCSAVRADLFELESGAQLSGTVVERRENGRTRVTIRLDSGGTVTIDRGQIARVLPKSPAEQEYARRAPSVADTVEAQWRLAMWCREQKMGDEFAVHLRRVIELDPLHEDAHKLLGYQKVNGRWLTREEVMASRGLVRYDGDYRTRQEVEMLERAKRGKLATADWRGQLAQWRRWLTGSDPERSAEAERAFANLTTPGSASSLARMIANEQDYAVRSLLIDTASRIEHPTTVQALVQLSLNDPDEETRLQCLEHLVKARRPGLSAPYLKSLKSNDNARVNRAAEALGEIGDAEAIAPLIDALVTTHKFKVGNEGGGDRYAFSPTTGGFQFGGDGPKIEERQFPNAKALSALVRLTEGVNLGYDQAAWRDWLTSRAETDVIDLRRDL